MKPDRAVFMIFCVHSATHNVLSSTFSTTCVLFLLHETLLAPPHGDAHAPQQSQVVTVSRCWGAALLFCAGHLLLGFATCLASLGVVRVPAVPRTCVCGRLEEFGTSALRATLPSLVTAAALLVALCVPWLGPSALGGIWLAVLLFAWYALDARCQYLLDTTPTDRVRQGAVALIGQGTGAVVVAAALFLGLRGRDQVHTRTHVKGLRDANVQTPRVPKPGLGALRWVSVVIGAAAIAVLVVTARLGRQGRLPLSRRRPDGPQSPLGGSLEAFRSFAVKSSQRPSMQCALMLTATLRFSDIVTGGGYLWFLLSCGTRRVNGLVVAALFLCGWGLPSVCGWIVQLLDVRSTFTKGVVQVLLVVRATVGAALFVAQFWLLGEATLDLTSSSSAPVPGAPLVTASTHSSSRGRLAAVTSLLVVDRAAVTMLVQLQPRVWDDVVREDKVLFNRTGAMTAATARLAWSVTQVSQSVATVLLALMVFGLQPPRLGDGAHFADGSGRVRRGVAIGVALTELLGAGPVAVLWGTAYNLTGRHLRFVELGTYEVTEAEQPV